MTISALFLLLPCMVLLPASLLLLVKVFILKSSMDEICSQLEEQLSGDTNILISVSSRDKQIRRLAARLNMELRKMKKMRRQYQNGNRELQDAIMNISHDLRTPLTAITGYLDLLETEEKSDNAVRYLSYIQNRAEALKNLTDELFCFAYTTLPEEGLPLEAVCLNAALEESIAAFYAALSGRGILPKIFITEKRIYRQLNKEALSRIFDNILNNALKYSGGDLQICLREDGTVSFSNQAPTLNKIQTGRLFDRFFSVEAAQNSTGLGLSIAKALTEQMNGIITACYENGTLHVNLSFPQS